MKDKIPVLIIILGIIATIFFFSSNKKFASVGGEMVAIAVQFTVYEGITSFNITNESNEFYLNLNSTEENKVNIELTTGNAHSYSKMILSFYSFFQKK